MAARAKKKKKTYDISSYINGPISQKCFFDDPLPKLLKCSCSAEQNGHQSLKWKKSLNDISSQANCSILK